MNVSAGSLPSLAPPLPEPAGAGGGLLAAGSLSRGAAAAAAAGIAAAADAFRTVLAADGGQASSLGGTRAGAAGWIVSPSAADAPEPAGYAPAGSSPSSVPTQTATATAALTAKAGTKSSTTKASTTKASTAKASTAKKTTSSTSSSRGEYAFLDDKKISIEEKLFRFMKITQQKGDAELVGLMKNYRELHGTSARSASSGGTSSGGGSAPASGQDEGGGLFGFLGDVVGLVGDAAVAVGGAAAKLAGQAGGPLLAAAATALGQPELVPVALAVGGELGKAVGGALSDALPKSTKGTSSSSGSSSSGSSSSSSDVGSPDEKLDMLEIQRAVEKQNQMFTLISNILKSLHETGMSEINNIR